MNYANSMIGVQEGSYATALGATNLPELGMIERASGLSNGLLGLHIKLGQLRDKIEGGGNAQAGMSAPASSGLPSHLSDAENALRACHSLLDDIAGKF